VEANVFKDRATARQGFPSSKFLASSEREINSSFPALASLQDGRFILLWAEKSSETFDVSTNVKAKIFSADQGAIGQNIQVNTSADAFCESERRNCNSPRSR
jgi:hypothetical protein